MNAQSLWLLVLLNPCFICSRKNREGRDSPCTLVRLRRARHRCTCPECGRVWGLWHSICKSEKLAVAPGLSRAPFKHGDEKGWGRYRWRQPGETWFYLTVQLMTFAVGRSPGGPWPPTSSTPGLRMRRSPPAPASTSASHSALWLIPDRMSFVSKELNALHPSVLAVWVREALPL